MSDHKKYNRRLDKIERDLDWIIQHLMKKDQPVSPSPHSPPPYVDGQGKVWPEPNSPTPTSVVNKCSECGIIITPVMVGYYCSRSGCPTGLGGVSYLKG
jgi:hypothetical protein